MTDIRAAYQRRYDTVLRDLAKSVEDHLKDMLTGTPRIDRVAARAKSVDRFMTKAETLKEGKPKYSDPLQQIQDQVGARIITFYLSDVTVVSSVIDKYLRSIETKSVVPESQWQFGYFGKHFILLTPPDVVDPKFDTDDVPPFFELQIKTLFQHAWSEAEHDVGYKPELGELDADETRRLAFTSAQAWGADHIFDDLFQKRTAAPRAGAK